MPINPNIRNTVAWLQAHGFQTCDSGDGETHDFECDRDHGYVVIQCEPSVLMDETHRLIALLNTQGITIEPVGQRERSSCVEIQATYDPANKIGLIDIAYITDSKLASV